MRDLLPPTAFVLLLLLGALPPLAHAGPPGVPDPAAANTIYVDTDASGAGDGTSWADAYTSLPDALQEARTNGQNDAVWVAEGTYYPDEGSSANADDRTESFRVESGIDLRGHFSGDEQHLDDRTLARGGPKTVLSGEIQQDGSQSNNAYTVLSIEGGMAGEVHIEGGAANGLGAQGRGGGAYVSGGTLHHVVLRHNRARRGAALAATGSPTLEVLLAHDNHATQSGALYFRDDASSAEHLTVADNTAEEGANGLYFADSDAALEDVAAGPGTTNSVAQAVTATITGNTQQEGQALPNADLTFTNVEADTTVGTTTSDATGDYEFSTSYPDKQAYTLEVSANTGDHEGQTSSISLTRSDNTYTENFDLERLIYDLAINTDDANTNNSINATGSITDANADTTITTYSTDTNGETTLTINTAADNITSEANTTNYDPGSTSITLDGTKDRSLTTNLPPIEYTFTGNANAEDGTSLNNATITVDDQDGNQLTTTSNTNGEYTTSGTVNDGLTENETVDITANKADYNPSTKQATANPDNRTQTTNFALNETVNQVTATFEGTTTQEGATLSNADLTFTNADADTTVGTTTTDTNGDYEFTTSYPDNQAYTLEVSANTGDHEGQTSTISLTGSDNTYTENFDLERLIYDITVNTDDADTGSPINATGDILHDGTSLATYTTGGDGEATVQINTPVDQVSSEANTANYDPSTESLSLGGTEDITITNQLPPITYTFDGNVNGENGSDLSNATITVADGDGNQLTTTTNTSGDYQTQGDVNDGLTEDETVDITANKTDYNPSTKQATADPDNRTQTTDFALTETTTTVTATFNGNTSQEGQTLPNADVTIQNADADTLVTQTTSDGSGFYETTTSYPDDQAYTAHVIANTDEHQADTTTVELATTDKTYTENFDLERLIYDITVNTDDADTGSPINATGDILHDGTSLASYTTGSDGETTVQVNTAADQVSNEANTSNYDAASKTVSLAGSKAVNSTLNLPPITYTFDGTVTDKDGTAVNNAILTLDDDDTNSTVTTQTGSNGQYTLTATVNDGFEEQDPSTLTADKDNYNASSTNTSTDPDNRTKTLDFTIDEQSTTDRVTITFNPKTVGDDLYSGGYSGDLDYTVSTDDTTFTTTGSTTADVPITDGDDLEISQSDSEYISTFMVNNTDTELPPMDVTPFPAEPDYQSTSTVSIDKSDVVNKYQVAGIPDTSPEGYDTIVDWKPHLDDSDVRRWTDTGGYSSLETYIQEGHSSVWEDKADEVVPEVQGFMPIPIDGPTYITDSDLQDVYDNRNENNITRIDLDASGTLHNYSGDFLQNSAGFFAEGDILGTVRSEVYNAFTGLDETPDHSVTAKILDNSTDEFISSEAKFPIKIIYNTESPTNIQ
ncbi:beta strand repeat-containing protein [Salinibacter sp.]|uniref:beta strand repeat-containing protein n=1 Tax=Salinibacter sp. TaxID=2065818 RepID=UPI0021E79779|nr:carboxypeptidase-like regulatory domain-containing protein [Salinibacter sp.]